MARRLPGAGLRIAEIGCGSGGMLEALARFGPAVGVELDPSLRDRARARGLDARAGALPDDLPLEAGRWDAVCLFDVLEHVADEAGALRACRLLLAPGGRLVLTVPAYAWLWSRHDELLGHRRRYTAGSLRAAVQAAGFAIERLTYFNTLLAAPIMAVRLVRSLLRRPGHDLERPRRGDQPRGPGGQRGPRGAGRAGARGGAPGGLGGRPGRVPRPAARARRPPRDDGAVLARGPLVAARARSARAPRSRRGARADALLAAGRRCPLRRRAP